MTLSVNDIKRNDIAEVRFKSIGKAAERLLSPLTTYYSQVLERRITTRQTALLLNAQTAFFITVFPASAPLLVRTACVIWLISALLKCRKALRTSC